MTINRTGYVPGEWIGFQAEMDNKSSREMKGTKLELLEHVRYMTPNREKTETRVVAQINRGKMGPGESDTWDGEDMRIPPGIWFSLTVIYSDLKNGKSLCDFIKWTNGFTGLCSKQKNMIIVF